MAKIERRYESEAYSLEKAEIIGKRLEKIGGPKFKDITPREVVEDARSDKSPLHAFFDWDDVSAGEKCRLWQARRMINTLRIVIIKGSEEAELRAYHSVDVHRGDDDDHVRVYRPVAGLAKSDADIRAQVVSQARREIESWRKRYAEYDKYFGGLFAEIDRLLGEERAL